MAKRTKVGGVASLNKIKQKKKLKKNYVFYLNEFDSYSFSFTKLADGYEKKI